ncbi:putative tyrosinase-like protein [Dirofilaria immitis]
MLPVDCNQAPPGFVEICYQLQQFNMAIRAHLSFVASEPELIINAPAIPDNNELSPALPNQFAFVPSVYDCLDVQCLCPYFGGGTTPDGKCILRNGQMLQRVVRKEIRMLTDDERERFFNAIQQLKASGEYDRLAEIHRLEATGSGAHSGPSFLPWHREFAKRMEIALRLIDPTVALPYWDSTLDQHLPNPVDSIIWSSILMGDTNSIGQVIDGPFAGFITLEGHPTITRNLGHEGRLFTDQDISKVNEKNTIEGILGYTAPTRACPYPPNFSSLEYYHSSVHIWIGGDMKPPVTSANDPIFYLHHSFVDYVFETWRQMHQNRIQRERDYPEEIIACTTPLHFANANMHPFNLVNRQGLSNAYTDYMYTYAPRPTCSHNKPSCNSQFLFCDLLHGSAHCVSKIKLGKRCEQFAGEDACYMGICENGFCKLKNVNSAAEIATMKMTISPTTMITCLNDDPCCSLWAKNDEYSNNTKYMSMYCRKSCNYCKNNNNKQQKGCVDRHISCSYMRSHGECIKRRQWMAENCRASCGWCNISIYDLCIKTAIISRM